MTQWPVVPPWARDCHVRDYAHGLQRTQRIRKNIMFRLYTEEKWSIEAICRYFSLTREQALLIIARKSRKVAAAAIKQSALHKEKSTCKA